MNKTADSNGKRDRSALQLGAQNANQSPKRKKISHEGIGLSP